MQRNRVFVSSQVSDWHGKAPINRSAGLGTIQNPATSGVQLYNAGFRADGVYYLNPTGNNVFKAYVILSRDGGGWVKVLQYNSNTNLSGTSAVNQDGSWCEAEINLAPGRLSTADITALQTSTTYLFRVKGGTDNLLNNGLGTGKFEYSAGTIAPWGTLFDPTANYTLKLDMTSDGTYEYYATYSNDARGLCGHGGNTSWQWVSDHNYAYVSGSIPSSLNTAQCWGHYPNYAGTNLHWMSGIAGVQSGGEILWGNLSTNSYAVYVK